MVYVDDKALRAALEKTVVLKRTDIPPCQWPQPVPCQNLGFNQTMDDALFLCLPHWNVYHRTHS